MAVLEELLNGSALQEDIDEVILIDPVLREVLIPTTELILGVAGDKRSECKYFKMPKVVGNGVDVTVCSLRVAYTNAKGDDDYFPVTKLVSNDEAVVFCWEISAKVAAAEGDVEFSVCVCRSVDGNIETEWNTTPAFGKVLRGHKRLDGSDDDLSTPDVVAAAEAAAKRAEAAAERAEAAGGAGHGGSISVVPSGDALIITTSMSVATDGDAIIIGGV